MSNRREILEKLAKGELDVDAAQKMLGSDDNNDSKHFRMTDRGAVAVLGLQRRAVVLYPNQWRRLNNKMSRLMDFINQNQNELKNRHDAYLASLPPRESTTNSDENTETTETKDEAKAEE